MMQNYELMKIVNVERYGIFVNLRKDVNALCHLSRLKKGIKQYHVGDYIWGKEIKSDIEGKFSVMECGQVEKNALFEEYIKIHSEGDIIKGCVNKVDNKNGTFINIYPGITALFHKSQYNSSFNAQTMQENKVITVQIGKIDNLKKHIFLIPVNKKNINVAVEVEGIEKGKFFESAEISGSVCESFRECTDNHSISDEEIRKLIAESYEKAVDEDAILIYNEAFTFQIQGKTKYGGALAAGGRKNHFEGKEWYVNFVGSSSKLAGNSIDLFAYVEDWSIALKELEEKLLSGENWDYKNTNHNYSGLSGELFILKQYLNYTFYCAKSKNLIAVAPNNDFAVFNTGLVDNVYEAIYLCFLPSDNGARKKWKYAGFCTYGTGYLGKLLNSKMEEPPAKVQYFSSINDMLFDTTKKLNWDKEHILIENINRLPISFVETQCDNNDFEQIGTNIENIKKGYNKQNNFSFICEYIKKNIKLKRKLLNRLDDAVSLAVKRCEWNYKTAIPIFYHVTNGISLLLPLCLSDDEQAADVALVVEKQESGNYQGQTILTLQMAYLDARLICRPNSEWLNPDRVIDESDNED